MIFGIGASEWLDVVRWVAQATLLALFLVSMSLLLGRLAMNGYLMLAGVTCVVIGLCMFATGWGMISP